MLVCLYLDKHVLKLTYTGVLTHTILSIGDMHQNGIQHHFFFFNIFLFLLGQGIYRSKYNISKGKTKLYNEYSITLIKLSINNN